MGKTVWIVNYYLKKPSEIRHARHLMFAKYLQEAGYNVLIFTADEYSGEGELVAETREFVEVKYDNYQYVHVKSSKVSSTLTRGVSIFKFARRCLKNRRRFPKPDLILQNIHEPFDYPICKCAKKMKAKYIVDDWDMWAYSFVRQGMVKKDGLLGKFIFRIDRKFFENADQIVFSMEGGKDYIRDMHWDLDSGGKVDLNKVHYINNGVDVALSQANAKKYKLDDSDLTDPNTFKAVYMGSVSKSNALLMFVQAAKELEEEKDFRFLIYGDGNERDQLEKYCADNNIKNVIFKQKSIPIEYVPYVLSKCDLNIISHKQHKQFVSYGVSLGKLFQAFASGKPICFNRTDKYDLIKRYNLGISDSFADAHECAQAILKLKRLPKEEYEAVCERVMKVAWQFDYKVLSLQLVEIVNNLLEINDLN